MQEADFHGDSPNILMNLDELFCIRRLESIPVCSQAGGPPRFCSTYFIYATPSRLFHDVRK